ncbi:unnamed protein product [Adineta steineri]|uniref:Uncharacterized protein n=2 Tax=Adineta steineri TaxID=433720 RepID=A0A815MKL2_9BILA|nr:unnamed protein product [Adineta steineri]CAF1298622.1 unnamed protein product [Adineta steineri]CAF1424256.1 unnamed protein product [Adineta steineri]
MAYQQQQQLDTRNIIDDYRKPIMNPPKPSKDKESPGTSSSSQVTFAGIKSGNKKEVRGGRIRAEVVSI